MSSLSRSSSLLVTVLVGAFLALFSVFAFLPSDTALAQSNNPDAGGQGPVSPSNNPDASPGTGGSSSGQQVTPPQTTNAVRTGTITLESPINCGGQTCSAPVIIGRIVNYILSFVGALAVVMLVIAGIMYMTSGGNEQKASAAKRTITFTIGGLVIVFLSLFVVNFTLRILGAA